MKSFFSQDGNSVEARRGPNGPWTILIVDDSPTDIYVLRGMLEKAGFNVLAVENGEAGVEEAHRSKPDLILMDVVMPGLNGFQATRQLSRNPETADTPVIMVTTKDQEVDRAWGLRQGAREYIVKPVEKAELLSMINTVLAG